jgi:acetylornithine deacetylase/succinyl-diaminopimelate desuccinylase-like protein
MSATPGVVSIAQDLIRIDTSNYGDDSGPGERRAAEYVAAFLSGLGLEPIVRESAPRRSNLTTLWEGVDRSRPPLVVHGHLDVVPAFPEEWRHPPFAAEVTDGLIWGRGAVDMKGTDAMILATVAGMIRGGVKPARDVVLGFFADEEAGGGKGARYMVDNHPDDFRGATEAISEVGGFSTQINGRRAYLIQTAEKGIQWLRLVASGTAGHGSLIHQDNAVVHLAEALARIGRYAWPLDITPTVEALLRGVAELTGEEYLPEPTVVDRLIAHLSGAARLVEATTRNTANPTQLDAGYKSNVIPDSAQAMVDTRFLPGQQEEVFATIEELAGPNVKVESIVTDVALDQPFDAPIVHKMIEALHVEDPGTPILPYALSGGTDNKSMSRLGIRGYGFAPLQLPPELDFPALFHGVDERVPIEGLEFGVRVLEHFLRDC